MPPCWNGSDSEVAKADTGQHIYRKFGDGVYETRHVEGVNPVVIKPIASIEHHTARVLRLAALVDCSPESLLASLVIICWKSKGARIIQISHCRSFARIAAIGICLHKIRLG